MKLNSNFIIYANDEDHILMDTASEFSGIVHSNHTAADIVELLQSETTQEEIVQKMMERYDASEEVVARDVKKILATLRSIHAIDETSC